MEVNEEKRKKFMEFAGKRVNNVMHDIQILEPMARSNSYDFTKEDVEKMFYAMQESLNSTKAEFEKKFEEKLSDLESIVKELENGNVDLDDAINKYTEAMKLAKECSKKLDEAEKAVNEILKEDGSLGEFKAEE